MTGDKTEGKACMLTALKKYRDFKGRASRREYWLFILLAVLLSCAIALIGAMMQIFCRIPWGMTAAEWGIKILWLLTLIPHTALAVRRCHDSGHTAWWLLVIFVPFFGPALWVATACIPSVDLKMDENISE